MANSFTAQLDPVNSGKNIVQPAQQVSFLGGLAQAGSNFLDATAQRSVNSARAAAGALAADHSAAEAQTANLLNRAVNPQNDTPDISFLNPKGFSPELQQQVKDALLVKQAVRDGKYPATGYALRVEAAIQTAERDHPESITEVLATLHSMGLDDYNSRGAKLSLKFDDTQRAAEQAAVIKSANYAYDNGIVPVGTPLDQAAAVGQQHEFAGYQLDAATKHMTFVAAQRAETASAQTVKDHDTAEAEKSVVSSILNYTSVANSSIMDNLGRTYSAAVANGDPKQLEQLASAALPRLNIANEAGRFQALKRANENNVSASGIAAINAHFDQNIKSYTSIFTGEASQQATNLRAYQALQTNWGLAAAQALPVYSYMKSILGAQAVNGYLNDDADFNKLFTPEQGKQLKAEMANLNLETNPNSMQAHLAILGQIMHGETNIGVVSEAQARKLMPTLVGTAIGIQNNVAAGNTDALPQWRPAYGNVILGVASLQDGLDDPQSLLTATGVISTPAARVALQETLDVAGTHDQGLDLVKGSRGAAARLMEIARAASTPLTDDTGVLKVGFNQKTLRWEVEGTNERYQAYVRSQKNAPPQFQLGVDVAVPQPIGVQDYQSILNRSDPRLKQYVDILNVNTDHLVNTAQYDTDLPSGSTPRDLRLFYAGVKDINRPAKGPTANEAFQASVDATISSLDSFVEQNTAPTGQSPVANNSNVNEHQFGPIADQAAKDHGLHPGLFRDQIRQESSFNPGSVSPTGPVGLGQFTRGTGKQYGLFGPNGEDYRTDVGRSLNASAQYMADLVHKHKGDYMAAIQDYGTFSTGRGAKADEAVREHFAELVRKYGLD